jgi:hypothetical protein
VSQRCSARQRARRVDHAGHSVCGRSAVCFDTAKLANFDACRKLLNQALKRRTVDLFDKLFRLVKLYSVSPGILLGKRSRANFG